MLEDSQEWTENALNDIVKSDEITLIIIKLINNKMDICIDFDGTCVTHEFPKIGKDISAVPVLNKIVKAGHNLILFTMRSDRPEKPYLADAVKWFKDNNIPLYGVNSNPHQKRWTNSPKAYGQLYIDDAALGCPLKMDKELSNRPFVDWERVKRLLIQSGVI